MMSSHNVSPCWDRVGKAVPFWHRWCYKPKGLKQLNAIVLLLALSGPVMALPPDAEPFASRPICQTVDYLSLDWRKLNPLSTTGFMSRSTPSQANPVTSPKVTPNTLPETVPGSSPGPSPGAVPEPPPQLPVQKPLTPVDASPASPPPAVNASANPSVPTPATELAKPTSATPAAPSGVSKIQLVSPPSASLPAVPPAAEVKQPAPSKPATSSTALSPSRKRLFGKADRTGKAPKNETNPPRVTQPKPEPAPPSNASTAPDELKDEPKDIEAYNRGVELFRVAQGQAEKGNLDGQRALLKEAVRQFQSSLKANPKRVEAQSNIGFVELTLRRYRPAVKAFEAALAIDATHANTLNGLATTYTLMDRTDLALSTSDKLLHFVPDNPQYWFNRGCILQKAGNLAEAKTAYEKALLINPKDQRALFNLGTLAEAQQQWDEAQRLFSQSKNYGIDTPVGLEAYRRLQGLEVLKKQSTPRRAS